MENLSLTEAFAIFGAKPLNRLYSFSAMAPDGAMILSCSDGRYGHPAPGVLRYEDHLTHKTGRAVEVHTLSEHLVLARDGDLPIRMIVVTRTPLGERRHSIHVRVDLVGKVIQFDGDHFIVDFVRTGDSGRAGKRSAARALKRNA